MCVCVFVCVCLCVCQSDCVSVQAMTFEAVDIETSFLVWRYILKISRSSLSSLYQGHWVKVISWKMQIVNLDISLTWLDLFEVKVIGLRSRSSH